MFGVGVVFLCDVVEKMVNYVKEVIRNFKFLCCVKLDFVYVCMLDMFGFFSIFVDLEFFLDIYW